jgi:hypothetical protein
MSLKANSNNQSNGFNQACQRILLEHPQALGIAYKVLDCGCAWLCGVSPHGDPMGPMIHVSGQTGRQSDTQPICLQCRRDKTIERVIWQGIYWPGGEGELPEKRIRIKIGRTVFGPEYVEPD